jgi:hypothetical protein
MPQGPSAKILDNIVYPLPPVLTPGPGCPTVLIGFLPAWRGIPLAAVAALQAAHTVAQTAIKVAEAATPAAAGTPGAPSRLCRRASGKGICFGFNEQRSNKCRRCGYSHVRYSFTRSATRSGLGYYTFGDRDDWQITRRPNGRYDS